MTFRLKWELFCGDLDLCTDKMWKYPIFYFICILAEIYNKIEMLLFIEALGATEEISLDWLFYFFNFRNYILTQLYAITLLKHRNNLNIFKLAFKLAK